MTVPPFILSSLGSVGVEQPDPQTQAGRVPKAAAGRHLVFLPPPPLLLLKLAERGDVACACS